MPVRGAGALVFRPVENAGAVFGRKRPPPIRSGGVGCGGVVGYRVGRPGVRIPYPGEYPRASSVGRLSVAA